MEGRYGDEDAKLEMQALTDYAVVRCTVHGAAIVRSIKMSTKSQFPIMAALTAVLLLGCPNPATPPPDNAITQLAIPGAAAPVKGVAPATSLDASQYTGTIGWSPTVSGTFAPSTVYTATITLTPKTGYILTGVTANSFTVAGATSVTHDANSGVAAAVFPATAANLSAASDAVSPTIGTLKAVQGGTFNNGAADMTVGSFRMGEHEITGEEYVAVMGGTDPSSFSSLTDNPVETVNWYAALVFCNKLSILEELAPVYKIGGSTNPTDWGTVPTSNNAAWNAVEAEWSANGYRLPTEAEWQFAARGGNSTHNYTYAGSNTIGDVAWYISSSFETTHTVGGKTANELGLFDMSGNVFEWCWDWYAVYPSAAQTDYRGPATGTDRVQRGGSWNNIETYSTVAHRLKNVPYFRISSFGFRVVRP
jgi:formylglycine-generating enzyme required for sulfatase activity